MQDFAGFAERSFVARITRPATKSVIAEYPVKACDVGAAADVLRNEMPGWIFEDIVPKSKKKA